MPESQSSLPDKLKKIRKVAAAVFVVLTLASFAVRMEADTFHVFLLIPTLLLVFARRFDIALVIECAVLGIWVARRQILDIPQREDGFDDFVLIYYGTIIGILVGFKLADFVNNWWQSAIDRAKAEETLAKL